MSEPGQWFESDPLWFKHAVFYEIHTRAFFDGNDDGSGDLRGVTDKLDYLQWLGVDCIWLLPLVRRLNEVRRANPALQRFGNLTLLETESEHLFAYAKRRGSNAVVAVVNTDPFETREGVAVLPATLGLAPAFQAEELLTGETFTWQTGRNFVRLAPGQSHLLRIG